MLTVSSSIMLILSVVFMYLYTPSSMVVILILEAICVSLVIAIMMGSVWLPYILVLVFLGGMLVIFAYVSSLAANDKLEKWPLLEMFFCLPLLFLFWTKLWSGGSGGSSNINQMFTFSFSFIYSLTVCYLFLALICIANLMKSKEGPLRLLN